MIAQPKPNELLEAALSYARRHWYVLPVQPNGKIPLGALVVHGHKQATRDEDLIRHWWNVYPEANVGVRTGIRSAIVVVDIDLPKGGEDSLYLIQERFEPFPETVESLTGGGGRHLFFKHPGEAFHVPNKTSLAGFSGLDIRGDGGFVVAPPSMHLSGRDYVWEVSSHPDEVELAPPPSWLLDLIATPAQRGATRRPSCEWVTLLSEGAETGNRNSNLAAITGHLLRHRVHPSVVLELMLAWNQARNRPPLPVKEVIRTVDSIAGAELRRRFHDRPKGYRSYV